MSEVCDGTSASTGAARSIVPAPSFEADDPDQGCSERQRRTEKAELLGHMTGGLVHDFNNLLSVILGNLERTRRLLPAETSALKCVADAMAATDRAVALVCRLLAFVRCQPPVPRLIEIDRLLLDLKPLLEVAAPSCAIVLDLDCTWQSLVDADQLENAVLNLVVNARDAMAGCGRMTIVTRKSSASCVSGATGCGPRDCVELEIRDAGVGMSPDVLKRATEPFFTTKAVEFGTGLGLSQVFGFVSGCGGTMQIVSEIDKGTSVTLKLPRADKMARADMTGVDIGHRVDCRRP